MTDYKSPILVYAMLIYVCFVKCYVLIHTYFNMIPLFSSSICAVPFLTQSTLPH